MPVLTVRRSGRLRAVVLAGTTVAALGLGQVAPATGAPAAPVGWEQFHAGPAHTGYQPHEATLTRASVSRLDIGWQKALGYIGGSSPAVVAQSVYVGAGQNLYALNTANGSKRWSQSLPGDAYEHSPAVVGGTVFTTSATFDGKPADVWAFAAGTGRRLWRTSIPTDNSHSITDPTVAGGLVYAAVSSYCNDSPCTPNKLFAFDASTGSRRWSVPVNGQVSGPPAVGSGVLHYGDQGGVVALDATTGAQLWRTGLGSNLARVGGTPAVANGLVYVPVYDTSVASRSLCAFDAGTGARRWCFRSRSRGAGTPTIANGLVYAVTSNQLYALDAVTGGTKWRRGLASIEDSPAVANGVLYVGVTPPQSGTRQVYALNAGTGVTIKSVPLGPYSQGDIFSSPAVYAGSVYVGYTEGYLTALRLR